MDDRYLAAFPAQARVRIEEAVQRAATGADSLDAIDFVFRATIGESEARMLAYERFCALVREQQRRKLREVA